MADQVQPRQWTGKRYTAAGTVESFSLAWDGGQLTAPGLAAPFPIVAGRTQRSCGKWGYQVPGALGTSGTILSLATDGQRIAICGRDVLLPDCRYQQPPSGTMDLFMEAAEFRDLLAAIDAVLEGPDRAQHLAAETVTIGVHLDRYSPARVIVGIAAMFGGMGLLLGVVYLASRLFGDGALEVLLYVLPVIVIATVVLVVHRRGGGAGCHLIIQGERLELTSAKPSSPNRVVQASEVAVEHYEYVQRGNQQTGTPTLCYPAIELGLPDMEPLAIRTTDTTLLERVAWPGVEPPRRTPRLVGPAELLWLHDYFASRGARTR